MGTLFTVGKLCTEQFSAPQTIQNMCRKSCSPLRGWKVSLVCKKKKVTWKYRRFEESQCFFFCFSPCPQVLWRTGTWQYRRLKRGWTDLMSNEQRQGHMSTVYKAGGWFGCSWLMLPCFTHLLGGRKRGQPGSTGGGAGRTAAKDQGWQESAEESAEGNSSWGEEKSRTRWLSGWVEWGLR